MEHVIGADHILLLVSCTSTIGLNVLAGSFVCICHWNDALSSYRCFGSTYGSTGLAHYQPYSFHAARVGANDECMLAI